MPDGAEMRQLIDNHVLEMVVNDQLYRLETLLINSYDHLLDIRGTKRNKTASEIAELKQLSHIVRFLNEHDKYKVSPGPRLPSPPLTNLFVKMFC